MARELVTVSKVYEYHPGDVAVSWNAVVAERFGEDPFRGAMVPWLKIFRRRGSVSYVTVKTSATEERRLVAGAMELKAIPGSIIQVANNVIAAEVPKESGRLAEELLAAVEERLKTKSIYRGKPLTTERGFLNLEAIGTDGLIYNAKVQRDLKAHVWTPIMDREACRAAGYHVQRKVLFAGPYGSGKTMAMLWTAKIAVEHGWTFMYIEPSEAPSKVIEGVIDFTKNYQPAVIAVEDFDHEQNMGDPYAIHRLMTALDGAVSKTNELMIIMTTNHFDKIGAAFKRPERIDKVIDFGNFTAEDAVSLLQSSIRPEFVDPEIDWSVVGAACKDYAPVFVRCVAKNAWLLAKSENGRITQAMLVEAAEDLHRQHEACTQEAPGFVRNR